MERRIPPHQKAAVTQGRVSIRQIGNRRVQSVADLPHGRKALIDQRRFRNAHVVGNIREQLCAMGHAFLLWSRTHSWQRVSDHVSLAHLLSASASWWAIRGVMPIHSTGVPNARMTLPPLAVTAYRSSPSSSGVRAPWVNLPVSPSGVPCARVSAFVAWIVSATVACCTASLNHRSPWCSSSCIMVSIRARFLDVSSVELASAMPKRAVDSAYICAKPPSTNNSVAVTKHDDLRDLLGRTEPAERHNAGKQHRALLL